MNLTTILTSWAVVLLLKWTSLLTLAWGAHGLLRHRDARWRLILWRSVLCFGLLLPMSQFVDLPGVKIPVGTDMVQAGDASNLATIPATGSQPSKVKLESTATTPATPQQSPERTRSFQPTPAGGVVCETTKNIPTTATSSAKVEFKKVLVVVQDDDGKPVAGATISPEGFRVKGLHGADAYTWRKDLFGPPEKVVTDGEGKAYIKYPVVGIPEEKEYTGKLFFSVTHPDYATARPQEYSVDMGIQTGC